MKDRSLHNVLFHAALATVVAGSLFGAASARADTTKTHIDRMFTAYATMHAALAHDRGAPVPGAAKTLAKEARAAARTAPAKLKSPLSAAAKAADALAKANKSDLAKLRAGFGQVSRALVSLVAADPALAKGRYVFYCPMAKGYKKWIQTSASIANPYMGTRMSTCGSTTEWN